ncbi:MAG: 50S ribosomal protein L3 [SAR202 cluster bacterium]|nr:50S ribosomal protein L3 [SAR202 cluster bacterium]
MPVTELIGKKIGMTQMFLEDGAVVAVTAIQIGPCTVTQVKTPDKDGYGAVQIGFDEAKKLSKPAKGHLKPVGKNFRHLGELRTEDPSQYQVGQEIKVDIFEAGDQVDAIGLIKGRGYQGVVRRHGFHGGPRTHGQSDRQRHPGSIGSGTWPGHVIKGLRMAGHMGDSKHTVKNMYVISVDNERNLLFVRGGVPGATNSIVRIRKSIRKTRKKG